MAKMCRVLQLWGLLLWWVVFTDDLYCVKAELINPVNNTGEDGQSYTSTVQSITLHNFTKEEIEYLYRLHAEHCWNEFIRLMYHVASNDWCDWTVISRPYSILQLCLEGMAEKQGYYYPNMFAESYIIKGHKTYFSNCTSQYLFDPPEDILLIIIFVPICIIPLMVMLVVFKSKHGKPQI